MTPTLRVLVLFLFVGFTTAESARCTFPRDFSHRNRSADPWLQSRAKRKVLDDWDAKQWSTIHKRIDARSNFSGWDVFKSEVDVEEYMKWAHGNARESARRFTAAYVERPWWRRDGSQLLSSFAVEDFEDGDVILNLPAQTYLSDVQAKDDPKSLYRDGAPWEVRLALKLLRERLFLFSQESGLPSDHFVERRLDNFRKTLHMFTRLQQSSHVQNNFLAWFPRSKGHRSKWATYIKLLPNFIPLPIFFSELVRDCVRYLLLEDGEEIQNVQDKTVREEVDLMRSFAKSTFQSLHVEDELARAKFAWALSVVFSSVCHVDVVKEARPVHFLIPFFYTGNAGESQVYASYQNEGFRLAVNDVKQGMALTPEYSSTTLRETFLFRGFVPKVTPKENVIVFNDMSDLLGWYCSAHGAVNHNRYLTWTIARDASNTLTAVLQESASGPLASKGVDFAVAADGYADNQMISILATLEVAKHVLTHDVTITAIDLVEKNGSTEWEGILKAIALEALSRHQWNMLLACKSSQFSLFTSAFLSAKLMVRERLFTSLGSFSTELVEDQGLMAVAAWEGVNEVEGDQLPCPSCRWQTEQMSRHDLLAVQFRAAVKSVISHVISKLTCRATDGVRTDVKWERATVIHTESTDSLQEFLKWCQHHNLLLSDKLAITEIESPAEDRIVRSQKHRGVVAIEDISQGQLLFTLPMSVGLFNNDSGQNAEVDAWDLAAARLLREKAKGRDSSYAPYIAILPEYLPTPIHLESQDVMEVQWLPMVRELVQVRKAIKESFAMLYGETIAWATFPEYQWAVTMVHSRAFTLPVRGENKYEQYVLMPIMDMINHHYRYQADWMSQDVLDNKLEIIARRTVRKGEELFASFGPRTNDNLFLYYGFLLMDNPFDSAPIFGSFEEALRWFLDLWVQNCTSSSGHPYEEAQCKQKSWQFYRERIKDALEEIESGNFASGEEWAQLMGTWADLGFQFLSYQPAPTIYPNGVIDPSLLAAFSTLHQVIHNVIKEEGIDFMWPDPCPECGNNSAVGSLVMRKFLLCIESDSSPPRGLLIGHRCRPYLIDVLKKEKRLPPGMLLARISVALRCSQILASFPTTIDQDRQILESARLTDSEADTASHCRVSQSPGSHKYLTWRYRYMKKLLLRGPIDGLIN